MKPELPAEYQSFRDCCRDFFGKKNLFRGTVINTLIAILLSGVFLAASTDNWATKIGINFVYSFSIGYSIYGIIGLMFYYIQPYPGKMRVLFYTLAFVFGGIIGTVIGNAGNQLLFDFSIKPKDMKYAFLFNIFLAIIFGTGATVYFTARSRLEETVMKLKEKEIQEQKLNQLRVEAQLGALQSQINPHFLFNTLNSISSLISENAEGAERMIEQLSGLLRYALQVAQKKVVPLTQELEIVKSYLEIEKIRLGDRLVYAIAIEGDIGSVTLPGMILQPIVENSIKHGIAPRTEGGRVDLMVKRDGTKCRITVKDNGLGLSSKESDSGYGLQNIRDRLQIMYGDGMEFKLLEDKGVRIEITIPVDPA